MITNRQLKRICDLAREGWTDAEIAAELGMSARTVADWRKRSGIAPGRFRRMEMIRDRIADMRARGMTNGQIAEEMGVSKAAISSRVYKHGLAQPRASQERERIIAMHAEGASQRAIARALRCARGTILRVIEEARA